MSVELSENETKGLAYLVHDTISEARELLDTNDLDGASEETLLRAYSAAKAALESLRAAIQSATESSGSNKSS